MIINGINHITISVKDIEESFIFYKNVLHFKPIMKSKFSAYFLCGKCWIALQEEKGIDRRNNSYSHIALNVRKSKYKDLIDEMKLNHVKEWKENNTEGESFYFIDPSGNKFEIHYSTLRNRIKQAKKEWKEVEFYK